jgi:hypothetical protein
MPEHYKRVSMSDAKSITRAEFLAMTPDVYLRRGFRDDKDEPFKELLSIWATAAATQLDAGGVPAQEAEATMLAFEQVLPLHEGPPEERFASACKEALELVSNTYEMENNTGLIRWLEQCAPAVRSEQDIADFQEHFRAVVRQYTLISGLKARPPAEDVGD